MRDRGRKWQVQGCTKRKIDQLEPELDLFAGLPVGLSHNSLPQKIGKKFKQKYHCLEIKNIFQNLFVTFKLTFLVDLTFFPIIKLSLFENTGCKFGLFGLGNPAYLTHCVEKSSRVCQRKPFFPSYLIGTPAQQNRRNNQQYVGKR